MIIISVIIIILIIITMIIMKIVMVGDCELKLDGQMYNPQSSKENLIKTNLNVIVLPQQRSDDCGTGVVEDRPHLHLLLHLLSDNRETLQ